MYEFLTPFPKTFCITQRSSTATFHPSASNKSVIWKKKLTQQSKFIELLTQTLRSARFRPPRMKINDSLFPPCQKLAVSELPLGNQQLPQLRAWSNKGRFPLIAEKYALAQAFTVCRFRGGQSGPLTSLAQFIYQSVGKSSMVWRLLEDYLESTLLFYMLSH